MMSVPPPVIVTELAGPVIWPLWVWVCPGGMSKVCAWPGHE
jgi:hypothetical protein